MMTTMMTTMMTGRIRPAGSGSIRPDDLHRIDKAQAVDDCAIAILHVDARAEIDPAPQYFVGDDRPGLYQRPRHNLLDGNIVPAFIEHHIDAVMEVKI
jgi:hypothetical protein